MMNGSMVAVWVAITVLAATLIGLSAAALAWLEARSVARALLVGGGTVGGALGLAIAAGALFSQVK